MYNFWPTNSFDVIVEGKRKGREEGKKPLIKRWGIGP